MSVINVVDEAFPQLDVRRWLVIFGYVVIVHNVCHVSFQEALQEMDLSNHRIERREAHTSFTC